MSSQCIRSRTDEFDFCFIISAYFFVFVKRKDNYLYISFIHANSMVMESPNCVSESLRPSAYVEGKQLVYCGKRVKVNDNKTSRIRWWCMYKIQIVMLFSSLGYNRHLLLFYLLIENELTTTGHLYKATIHCQDFIQHKYK